MRFNRRLFLLPLLCALAVGAVTCAVLCGLTSGELQEDDRPVVEAGIKESGADHSVAAKIDIAATGDRHLLPDEPQADIVPTGRVVVAMAGQDREDAANERLLTEVVNNLLDELSDASQAHDFRRVSDLLAKLRKLKYGAVVGSSGSSRSVVANKKKILESLAGFGYEGLVESLDFLSDPDPEIVKSATELLFDSLNDYRLSDHQRAEAVTAAAEALTDETAINRLYGEFIKMRHSVGAAAFVQIDATGTEQARQALPRAISAFAADVSITSASQLKALVDSGDFQDGAYDSWFYGKEKLTLDDK